MMKPCFSFGSAVAAILCIVTFSGCQTFHPAVNLSVDSIYENASIQVDMVGINPSQYKVWTQKSVSEYFSPGDEFRKITDKKTFAFGQNRPKEQVLSRNDPIWKRWRDKGVSHIFVLADLPGISDEKAEKRRQIIPLDRKAWKGSQTLFIFLPREIKVNVSPTGVEVIPPPTESYRN